MHFYELFLVGQFVFNNVMKNFLQIFFIYNILLIHTNYFIC